MLRGVNWLNVRVKLNISAVRANTVYTKMKMLINKYLKITVVDWNVEIRMQINFNIVFKRN